MSKKEKYCVGPTLNYVEHVYHTLIYYSVYLQQVIFNIESIEQSLFITLIHGHDDPLDIMYCANDVL